MHAKGETILIVTHDPRIAERCERVVSIVDGRIEDDTHSRDLSPPGLPDTSRELWTGTAHSRARS